MPQPQTSESLRALMATYADGLASGPRSMKAIDPSLWQIPELSVAQASEEEWAGAERRSRVGLEHMGIRCVRLGRLYLAPAVGADAASPGLAAQEQQYRATPVVRPERASDPELPARGRGQGARKAGRDLEGARRRGQPRAAGVPGGSPRLLTAVSAIPPADAYATPRFPPQESTGQHLASLESRWQDLVSSTVQLEMANTALEGMLGNLQRRRDAAERELRDVEAQE